METLEKITWSSERQKWLCYDDKIIDSVVNSENFHVHSNDYSDLEKKFSKDFQLTKLVNKYLPLTNEGKQHLDLRKRMSSDINLNLKKAIQVFRNSFEKKISQIDKTFGVINIAKPLIESILESNLILAEINFDDPLDYTDLTLLLDDSQSIKARMMREEFIKSIASKINDEDKFYKLALISVGVNALISTTLHSIIKILTNYDYDALIRRKYFTSIGIKHLERVCFQKTVLDGKQINAGDRLRLYIEVYENTDLTESQMNKKFFASGSHHACVGMSYSLSIWKEIVKLFSIHFSDLRMINFDYRSNDGIFNFPTSIYVEYLK